MSVRGLALALILCSVGAVVAAVPGDTCATAIVVDPVAWSGSSLTLQHYKASTVGAITESNSSGCGTPADNNLGFTAIFNDVWLRIDVTSFQATPGPYNMGLVVSLCGSGTDWTSLLEVYSQPGCPTPGDTPLHCADREEYGFLCSGIAPSIGSGSVYFDPWELDAASTIWVRVGGVSEGAVGDFELSIWSEYYSSLQNQYCDYAAPINRMPLEILSDGLADLLHIWSISYRDDNNGAPNCSTGGGNWWSVWYTIYSYSTISISFDTIGTYYQQQFSPLEYAVEVYNACATAGSPQNLATQVQCQAASTSSSLYSENTPRVNMEIEGGKAVYIRVSVRSSTAPSGSTYPLITHYYNSFPNDDCPYAKTLDVDSFGYVPLAQFSNGESNTKVPRSPLYNGPTYVAPHSITYTTSFSTFWSRVRTATGMSDWSNTGCALDPLESPIYKEVTNVLWFAWTAPADAALVDIKTCGPFTSIDTVIDVYDACPTRGPDNTTWVQGAVACDNDDFLCGGDGKASWIRELQVTPGQKYYIRVGTPALDNRKYSYTSTAIDAAFGRFQLAIVPSGGGVLCERASGLDQAYYSALVVSTQPSATATPGPSCMGVSTESDVWFDYLAPADGFYWFSGCNGGSGVHLAVYNSSRTQICPPSGIEPQLCRSDVSCFDYGDTVELEGGQHYRIRAGVPATAQEFRLAVARKEYLFTEFASTVEEVDGFMFEVERVRFPMSLLGLQLIGRSGEYYVTVYVNPNSIATLSAGGSQITPFNSSDWVVAHQGMVTVSGFANLGPEFNMSEFDCRTCFPWANDTTSTFTVVVVADMPGLAIGPHVLANASSPSDGGRFANPDMVITKGYPVTAVNGTFASRGTQARLMSNVTFTTDVSGPRRLPLVLLRYFDPALHPLTPGELTTGDSSSGGEGDGLSDSDLGAIIGASAGGGGLLLLLCVVLGGMCAVVLLVILCVVCIAILVVIAVVVVLVLGVIVVVVIGFAGVIASGAGSAIAGLFTFKRKKKALDVELMNFFDVDDDGDGLDLKAVLAGAGVRQGRFREIDWDDLKIRRKLGEGAFGKVYKARWRGADVAVKTINIQNVSDLSQDVLNEFRSEASLMELLGNHPNVVGFVGAVVSDTHMALVTEFCSHGSLFDLLYKENHPLTEQELLVMARDAASAISHLHSEGVVHRDIATRNLLVAHDWTVRISDFGMSRVVDKADDQATGTTKSNVGPVKWMAPESITSRTYSPKSDAFMFGVMLWEMWTREDPYGDMPVLDVAVGVSREGLRLSPPSNAPSPVCKLMKHVWHEKPEKRPDFKAIEETLNSLIDEKAESSSSESDFSHAESAGSIAVPFDGSDSGNANLESYTIPTNF